MVIYIIHLSKVGLPRELSELHTSPSDSTENLFMQTETLNVLHRCETTLVIKRGRWVDFCDESGECGYHVPSGSEISCDLAERNSSSLIMVFKIPSNTFIRINGNRTAFWTEYIIFMLQCIVIDFFLNNQPDAPVIQIYSVIKLYMFRTSSLLIIRSFLLYIQHWNVSCRFLLTASKHSQDGTAVPSWLCLERVIKNLHETYQCWIYSRKLLIMGTEVARNM